jgi:hypothetical protein
MNTTHPELKTERAQRDEPALIPTALISTAPKHLSIAWCLCLLAPSIWILGRSVAHSLQMPSSWLASTFATCVWGSLTAGYLALVYSRWNKIVRTPYTGLAWILVVAGFLSYAAALAYSAIFMVEIGWVLHWGAWLASHDQCRNTGYTKMLELWPAAWFHLKLPDSWISSGVEAYQQALSSNAAICFDALGLVYRNIGDTFVLSKGAMSTSAVLANSLPVACILFAGWFFFTYFRRPLVLLPIYLGTTFVWAFGMHSVQLIVSGYMIGFHNWKLSNEPFAVLLSSICAFVVIALIVSTDRLLCMVFMPVPLERPLVGVVTGRMNPLSFYWSRLFLPLVENQENT